MTTNNHLGSVKIGDALNRTDGPAKVQGAATYAAEHTLSQKPLIGWVVTANTALGTIQSIDATAAESSTGVAAVLSYLNAPKQTPYGEPEDEGRFVQSRAVLQDNRVRYFGFPVALILADTLEQARYAASLVKVEVKADEAASFTRAQQAQQTPEELDGGMGADAEIGEFGQEFSAATKQVTATYTTPSQVSAAMEPHACVADYDGTKLTVYMSIQIVASAVSAIANTVNMDEQDINIICPFVGGGFGSKLSVHPETILACLGAIHAQRPVKVVASRRQVFHLAPHRGNSYQDIRLGATASGQITAIEHKSYMPMARDYEFAEPTGAGARATYAAKAINSTHRVKVVDLPSIDSTRSPGDAIGSLAFESAIDELAKVSGVDPLQFRLDNMPTQHPISGKPFSSHQLKACLQVGAAKFGWNSKQENAQDSTMLTGYGVASAIRLNMLVPCSVRLEICSDGKMLLITDMTDIGTGTYTILTQIVSEHFSLTPDQITVDLGNSQSPASCGSGGSFGASSCGSATFKACQQLNRKIRQVCFPQASDGRVAIEGDKFVLKDGKGEDLEQVPLTALFEDSEHDVLKVTADIEPGAAYQDHELFSYGAHFAEVKVNKVTGEVKIARQLGVFSAGKILNHKTASSQLKGGMVWGAGYALREDLWIDQRDGSFVNCDFAEYHLPVNRDIGEVEVHFIEEPDYKASALGSKGVGELGITGAGAAIANAVADATGVRVRSFPITLDKIFPHLCDD